MAGASFKLPLEISPQLESGPLSSPYTPTPPMRPMPFPTLTGCSTPRRTLQEREVSKLREQVEILTDMVRSQMQPTNEEVDLLIRERDELKARLERTEFSLVELQKGIVSLQSEYQEDAEECQRQIEELKCLVQEREGEKTELKRNLDKTLVAHEGLKGYLKDLPSVAEFEEMKRTLKQREEESKRLEERRREAADSLQLKIKEVNALADGVRCLEREKEELSMKLASTEDLNLAHEKRLSVARELERSGNVEEILADKDKLAAENTKLKKYLKLLKRNQLIEEKAKAETIRQRNEAEAKVDEVNERLAAATKRSELLQIDLTAKDQKLKTAVARADVLEKELRSFKNKEKGFMQLEASCNQLSRDISSCVQDLSSLSSITQQLMHGDDPDVSALLGIRLDDDPPERNREERLDDLQVRIREVKRLKETIGAMRSVLADQYADKLADNMTSCTTQ